MAAVPLAYGSDPLSFGQDDATQMASATNADQNIPWQRRLRRIGQTNFTEHDPAVFDIEGWADYWASAKVGAVFISVTGILAYYPSQVPFHRHGKFLNGRDFFGELYAAARKRGLHAIARYSPDLNWGDALAAHPEWFMRDEEGRPKSTQDTPELFQTCMFSTYMTDYFPAVMREVNSAATTWTRTTATAGLRSVCPCATATFAGRCRRRERLPTGTNSTSASTSCGSSTTRSRGRRRRRASTS